MNENPSAAPSIDRPATRVALWDNVKFVMIILMTVGHFVDAFEDTSHTCRSIYLYVYAFHMPLFIFISGLFYSEKNKTRKIVYYVLCGFALKLILAIMNLLIYHSTEFTLLGDSGFPWFMFALAAFQALMYLCRDINKSFLFVFNIILACFVGYDQSVGDYLYLSRIVVFFPVFLLGTMVNQKAIIAFIKKHYKVLLPLSILVLALWFYLCFFKLDHFYIYRHLFTARKPFSKKVIGYGPLARLLCYFITFTTGFSILVIFPKEKIPLVTSLGARTLNVFIWHWPFYQILSVYFGIKNLFAMSLWGKVAFVLIPVMLSLLLMSIKLFDYPLKWIKKYVNA